MSEDAPDLSKDLDPAVFEALWLEWAKARSARDAEAATLAPTPEEASR